MTEAEDKALAQGWQDRDTWVANGGDPTMHKSAEKWLADGEQINRVMNLKARKYEDMLASQRTEYEARLARQDKQIGALQKGLIMTSQREYERAKERIKAELKAAAEEGDTAATDRLLGEMDALDKNREETAKLEAETASHDETQPDGTPQEVKEWLLNNSWMTNPQNEDDVVKTAKVNWAAYSLARENPNASGADIVKRLNETVEAYEKGKGTMTTNPDITPQAHKPRQVAGGDHYGVKDNNDKSWANLPQEAKDACLDFQNRGLLPEGDEGREKYVKDYVWDDHQRGAVGVHHA